MVDRTLTTPAGEIELNILTEGHVPDSAMEQAEREVRRLLDRTPDPVLFARVKMIRNPSRTDDEQCMAQGTLDMSGTVVRAQVAAPSMAEALDALGERLERIVLDVGGRRESRRSKAPVTEEGEWWSGALPTRRPSYFPRPPEEREVVRHKTYAPARLTPEEAVFDMRAMDYRFFLFTNAGNGAESVVYETGQGDLMIRQADGGEPPPEDLLPGLQPNPAPAAEATLDEARRRLDASDEPFVFFRDPSVPGARVLYRRYDGHYGLIEPRREG